MPETAETAETTETSRRAAPGVAELTQSSRKIAPMSEPATSHLWIAAFAGRMLQLREGMSLYSAVQCAIANYHGSRDLEPLEAAAAYSRLAPKVRPPVSAPPKYEALFAAVKAAG